MDEIALPELVLDELVGGAGVGHAQQRFRQHHQRQTFLGRQRELPQHVFHPAEPVIIGADGFDQPRCGAIDTRLLRAIQPRALKQAAGHGAIVACVGGAEGRSLWWLDRHGILSIEASLPPVEP